VKAAARFFIGVDLGGSQIKAVALTKDKRVLKRIRCRTHDEVQPSRPWLEPVRKAIQNLELLCGGRATGIGLAAPGVMADDFRSVAWCPGKLNGIEGIDWTLALGRHRTVPLMNDAQAALLGEHWAGAQFQHAVLLTLGTGVGGAILCDGKLLRGAHGRAGILGYMSLDLFGRRSHFNVPGPLEEWIGNRTVSERSHGRFQDTRELVAAVRSGDEDARRIWRKSVHALAVAICSLALILDPEAIIIGGGIAGAGPVLFKALAAELDELEWRPGGRRMKILRAKLGEWAGAIGAACLGMNFQEQARRSN
jgi:glucokinase